MVFEGSYECEASQTERRGIIVAKFEVLIPWRIFKQGNLSLRGQEAKVIFMGPALLVRNKTPSQLLMILKLLFSL